MSFKNRAIKLARMLQKVIHVSTEIQKRSVSISDYRMLLDEISDTVGAGRNNTQSPFFRCNIDSHYIGTNCYIVKSPTLESGVVKIQQRMPHSLSNAEKSP